MKSLLSVVVVLGLVAAACSASDTVFEFPSGLECSTEWRGSEQSAIREDAVGLPTRAAAAEAAMGRWVDVEGGEVLVGDGLGGAEREPGPVGVLVVDGKRVVIVIPTLAPAGGWLVRTTLWCEGYDPST